MISKFHDLDKVLRAFPLSLKSIVGRHHKPIPMIPGNGGFSMTRSVSIQGVNVERIVVDVQDGLNAENAGAICCLFRDYIKLLRPALAPYLRPCRQRRRGALLALPYGSSASLPMLSGLQGSRCEVVMTIQQERENPLVS